MITKEQALTAYLFHATANTYCKVWKGSRGAHHQNFEHWRRNGATKTWKRQPERFQIPIKYGMYGPYGYITNENARFFHVHSECPAIKKWIVQR